jgi:hypothetical protein
MNYTITSYDYEQTGLYLHLKIKYKPIKKNEFQGFLCNVFKTINIEKIKILPLNEITCFHSEAIPQLEIDDYFTRLYLNLKCENKCFILALIYINRVLNNKTNKNNVIGNKEIGVNSFTIHRLLLVSLYIAYFQIHCGLNSIINNSLSVANIGGVSDSELNNLTINLMSNINVNVEMNEIFDIYNQIQKCNYKISNSKDNKDEKEFFEIIKIENEQFTQYFSSYKNFEPLISVILKYWINMKTMKKSVINC